MGKNGQALFTLLTDWPSAFTEARIRGRSILCPALRDLPPADALALAMLPIHDANGLSLEVLARAAQSNHSTIKPDYVGLCLTDPFRRMEDLFSAVRSAGITGIVNLPSIAALMKDADDRVFGTLYARELFLMDQARDAGFSVLRITCDDFPVRTGPGSISLAALRAAPIMTDTPVSD